jgi:hypothetical protein
LASNSPRRQRLRGAALLLGLAFGALVAPTAAFAAEPRIKLALLPVGQPGSYFDLTMRPGETRSLQVDVANHGQVALAVRTYASDVYTIINGGFGGRLRQSPRTGMTTWLDYRDAVSVLAAGTSSRRTFAVTVPAAAAPGEYIAGLVLENDRPILGGGAIGLAEVIRQAVAVVVTVPGTRTPGLAIGGATHMVVAGRSIVSIAVENTGNVRLKPMVGFTLFDAGGRQISQASLRMDTFYAHTTTTVELPLASLLTPGTYTVRLSLDDGASGADALAPAIPLAIDSIPEATGGGGGTLGLIDVLGGVGDSQVPLLAIVIAAVLLFAIAIAVLVAVRRRRRNRRTRARIARL